MRTITIISTLIALLLCFLIVGCVNEPDPILKLDGTFQGEVESYNFVVDIETDGNSTHNYNTAIANLTVNGVPYEPYNMYIRRTPENTFLEVLFLSDKVYCLTLIQDNRFDYLERLDGILSESDYSGNTLGNPKYFKLQRQP